METKGLLISIFQLAEKGGLDNIEQKDIVAALNSFGKSSTPKTYKERFTRVRGGTINLLEQIEKCIDVSTDETASWFEALESVGNNIDNMPFGATIGDDAETFDFIKGLSKEYYNFSDAEKLIGVTRQSISKWSKEGKYAITLITRGERQVFSKMGLIEFYRAYNGKDGFGY